MARSIVYCSACKNYYEDTGGRLIKINKNELTTKEEILCTRPAFDLASWTNHNKTCGCKKTAAVSRKSSRFSLF
jgi:hypothetical protein